MPSDTPQADPTHEGLGFLLDRGHLPILEVMVNGPDDVYAEREGGSVGLRT